MTSSSSFQNNISWRTLNNNEIFKRYNFACATHKDRYILLAGGFMRSAIIVDMYNSAYSALPDLPISGSCCEGIIIKGYFYVIVFDQIYRISLSSQSILIWEQVPCEVEGFPNAIVSDGKHLFILYRYRQMIRYDPEQNETVTMPHMPMRQSPYATAAVGDKVYVITLLSMEVFDISSESWKKAHPLPKPVYNTTATVMKKRWIVVTGEISAIVGPGGKRQMRPQTFVFDTFTNIWTQKDIRLSPARKNHRCVALGSNIIAVGGRDGSKNYCPVETIHVKHLISDWAWESLKHLIILRQLVVKGRAVPVPVSVVHGETNFEDEIVQSLMKDLNADIFREVLTFLI